MAEVESDAAEGAVESSTVELGEVEVVLRPFEPADEPSLSALFERRAHYFEAATGSPPGPADVQSLFYSRPDGASEGQKRVLSVVVDGDVVGVIDAIEDFPSSGIASVGLFMLDPSSILRGKAHLVIDLALREAGERGMTVVRAGCPVGWTSGERLLAANGFVPDDGSAEPDRGAVTENRVVHPAESLRRIRRWTLSIG